MIIEMFHDIVQMFEIANIYYGGGVFFFAKVEGHFIWGIMISWYLK